MTPINDAHSANARGDSVAVGDVVVTPLGWHARVIKLRVDGRIDAIYVGQSPRIGEVVLAPSTLRRMK